MLLVQFTRVKPVEGIACDVFDAYIARHTARPAFGEMMAWWKGNGEDGVGRSKPDSK